MQHTCNAHAAPLKSPIALCASLVLMAELCSAHLLAATVPTEWTVRIGPRSASYQAERRHGDALDLRATLTYNGQPLAYTGPARLYAQTNGMGSAWWDLAPCTVVSNTLQATWLPSFDTGADVVDLFLGGPSNYQAAARIRFLPSPGSVPNSLPLPAPTLDFATVQILNPPYYTRQETDSAIESAAPGDYSTVSNRAMSAIQEHQSLEPSTNYTDAVAAEFENGARSVANANGALQSLEADYARSAGEAQTLYSSDGGKGYSDILSASTNAASWAACLAAEKSTNYTDAVAAEFENGDRKVDNATQAYSAYIANNIIDFEGEAVSYGSLVTESTNAATWAANQVMFYTQGGTATLALDVLTYQAASNSVGSVALLAGTNVLHITAPASITGRVRDFGLTVTTEDAATITLDTSVSWRFDAASTNLSAGSWNRIYCTESPTGVFSLQLWTPDSAQEASP